LDFETRPQQKGKVPRLDVGRTKFLSRQTRVTPATTAGVNAELKTSHTIHRFGDNLIFRGELEFAANLSARRKRVGITPPFRF
jgi:hypothetical protein